MLEAPFAIVALCAPAIGQLGLRSFAHGRLTSLFGSLFGSRGSGGSSGARTTQKSKDSRLGSLGGSSEIHRSRGAGDYEEMHSIHDHKGIGQDAQTASWVEETWPASNNSTTAFANSKVIRRSDDSAVPLGPVSSVRNDPKYSNWAV